MNQSSPQSRVPENPSRLMQVLLLVGVIDLLAIILWAVLTYAR